MRQAINKSDRYPNRKCLAPAIAIMALLTGFSQANTTMLSEPVANIPQYTAPLLARLIIEDASPDITKTPPGFHDVFTRAGFVRNEQGDGNISSRIRTFDRREALQVARTLARAKIARLAPGNADINLRDKEEITTLNDAARYLQILSRGFPYEEIWQTSERNGEFTVRLRARLRNSLPPQQWVKADVVPKILSANQSLTIKLKGLLDSTVAVYAWQADNTVVRLYPDDPRKPMDIKAGRKVQLPNSDDHIRVLKVRPMPGSRGNHEAIIVLASDLAKGISSLAPGLDYRSTGERLPTTGDFLNRLSRLKAGTYQIIFQPYQVLASQ